MKILIPIILLLASCSKFSQSDNYHCVQTLKKQGSNWKFDYYFIATPKEINKLINDFTYTNLDTTSSIVCDKM